MTFPSDCSDRTYLITLTTALSRTKNKVLLLQVKQEDEAAAVEADWKFAAMVSNITMLLLLMLLMLTRALLQVIDRLCLIVYTLFTIIASVTVIWTAPHVIVA